ncbi:MAG TPA: hypothetical protein DCS93_44145 [Microscillaceae bacterium]|nr:hypothetical protein [Microscillaceae bacterium]
MRANSNLWLPLMCCLLTMGYSTMTQAQVAKGRSQPTSFEIKPKNATSTSANRGKKRPPIVHFFTEKGEKIASNSTIETKKNQILVKGKIVADYGIKSIVINGANFGKSNDGNISVYFPAPRANNGNKVVVTDGNGAKTTFTFNIRNTTKGAAKIVARATNDTKGPVIKLTSAFATRGLKKKNVYQINGDKAEITGELQDASGIKSLTINGKSVSVFDNRKFQYIYPLTAKKTEVAIKATDNNNNTSVLKFILEKTNQAVNPNETNLYLVSIGISKFKKREYNLTYADDDAQGIYKTFTAPQNKKLFKNIKSKILLNEQATRTNIIKSFQWLRKNATAKDLVVLFIASHGFNEDDNFYILPHDGNPDELLVSGVNWSALAITLSRLACRKMVFVDACHSAQLGEDLVKTRGANASDIRKAQQILKRKEYGTVLFSAASKAESSLEAPRWKHGAFTLAVMEALSGKADKNGDGIVFLSELNLYTLERVKELTKGAQHPSLQNPASITQLPLCIVR